MIPVDLQLCLIMLWNLAQDHCSGRFLLGVSIRFDVLRVVACSDLQHCYLVEDHALMTLSNHAVSTVAWSTQSSSLILQVGATISRLMNHGGVVLQMML